MRINYHDYKSKYFCSFPTSKQLLQCSTFHRRLSNGFCADQRLEDGVSSLIWWAICWVQLALALISRKLQKNNNEATGKQQVGRKGKDTTCSWIFLIMFSEVLSITIRPNSSLNLCCFEKNEFFLLLTSDKKLYLPGGKRRLLNDLIVILLVINQINQHNKMWTLRWS